jgi:hypothetical protein
VRYEVRKNLQRHIQQDRESDVYFWDGEVCVRSTAITVGNPPSNTISIAGLQGVSVSRAEGSTLGILGGTLVLILFLFLGFSSVLKFPFVGGFFLLLAGWVGWLLFRPAPWQVILKSGGLLSDEVFSSDSEDWARRFGDAVSQAILARHPGGSGGQPVPAQAIFPDPVLTRN